MKSFALIAILVLCMALTVQASAQSSPAGFWSLVRGDNLVQSAHMYRLSKPGTLSEFNTILKQNRKPTLVMFGSRWYLLGSRMETRFISQAPRYDFPFMEVETDINKETASKYGFRTNPTYMLISTDGNNLWSITGEGEGYVNRAIEVARGH